MLTARAELGSSTRYAESDGRGAPSTQDASRRSKKVKGAVKPSVKCNAGVELWEDLNIDHDALRDALEEPQVPLNSHLASRHDDEVPATPWTPVLTTKGGPEITETIASYWQNSPSPSASPPCRQRPRSVNLAAARGHGSTESASLPPCPLSQHNRALSEDPCACEHIPQLRHRLANLYAGNSNLMTPKTAHDETIAVLHDNMRNQNATILRQEKTIAELSWQLQAKETEQASIIENSSAEIASRNQEIAQLSEDKWYLMGRVEALGPKVAMTEEQFSHDGPASLKPRAGPIDGSVSMAADEVVAEDHEDGAVVEKSPSPTQSFHSIPSSPIFVTTASIGNADTPTTMFSPLFSLRPRSSASNRSLYVVTPTPSVCRASYIQVPTHDDNQSRLLTSARHNNKHSHLTSAFGTKDGPLMAEQHSRHSRDSQSNTAAQAVPGANARLEQDLVEAQEKLATLESRSLELQAQVACQATLIQQSMCTSVGPTSTSSAYLSVPDLPVLTYTRSGTVWLDRLTSSFAYLGLLDFIQRDVPRPETSTWDTTEVTDWTLRQQRAVVLLKHAVSDDILEDVLHLQGRKETSPGERDFVHCTSAMNDPHQLLSTIKCLRRIISATASDLSWLDRIESADFHGIEAFTSLVLCVDKRHSVMYGTSADNYDALLPKLQETMERLFPELKGSMFVGDFDRGVPRKWRQLPIWMAKVMKRRQTSEDF